MLMQAASCHFGDREEKPSTGRFRRLPSFSGDLYGAERRRGGGESITAVNTSLDRFRSRCSLGLLAVGVGGGALDPGAAAVTARLFLLLLFVVAAEWISFPGGVDGVATAASRILSSGALSRLVGAPLQRRWRALGGVFRSSWRAARRKVSPLPFCLVETEQAVGFVEDGWPDLARLPLGGGGR